jgi:hypothetical protein
VDANGLQTTYHWEYGLTTGYGSSTTTTYGGAANNALTVATSVTGLSAGVLYHFRLSATNPIGTVVSADLTLTTTGGATVPGAPTIGAATPGVGSASVTFTAPGSNGGAAIDVYRVTSSLGPTGSGASSPITVSGLAASAQTFTVAAHNSVGYSAESAASNSVTPSGSASTQNILTSQVPTQLDLSDALALTLSTRFSSDIDGQVTNIRVYRATTAPTTLTALLWSDTGTVLAQQAITVPGTTGWNSVAITPVNITAGTNYRVGYFSNIPYVATNAALPITNSHLTASGSYWIYNAAPTFPTNASTADYFADVTFSYVPVTYTIPGPPTSLVATAGTLSANVAFTPPSNLGGGVTSYTVTARVGGSPSGQTGSGATSPITVSSLLSTTAYTFTATATNPAGTSTASTASNSVTPSAPSTGFPDATNTGVPSGTSLTVYNGNMTYSTAGGTLQNYDISGWLTINASNVTVKNCRIRCIGTPVAQTGVILDVNSTLQDCEIGGGADGVTHTEWDAGVWTGGITTNLILRCNIHHTKDGMKHDGGTTVQDCYIHDLPFQGDVSGVHSDCVQTGDGGASGYTFQHNTFSGSTTSCIFFLAPVSGPGSSNILINNNQFLGNTKYGEVTSYAVHLDPASTNVTISNNVFNRTWELQPLYLYGTPGTYTNNTYIDDGSPAAIG